MDPQQQQLQQHFAQLDRQIEDAVRKLDSLHAQLTGRERAGGSFSKVLNEFTAEAMRLGQTFAQVEQLEEVAENQVQDGRTFQSGATSRGRTFQPSINSRRTFRTFQGRTFQGRTF